MPIIPDFIRPSFRGGGIGFQVMIRPNKPVNVPIFRGTGMAIIKATMLFQGSTKASEPGFPKRRIAGWSESWYFQGTLEETQSAMVGNGGLCSFRAPMLPLGSSIVGQRFQSVEPIGPSATTSVLFPGNAANQSAIPQKALYINCPGVGVANTKRALHRGIPDAMVQEGEFSPSASYVFACVNYIASLASWRFKGLDKSQPKWDIASVTAAGLLTTVVAHTAAVGNFVDIRGTHENTSGRMATGDFQILEIPQSNQMLLKDWPYNASKGGSVQVSAFIYPLVNTAIASPVRITTRKVGRPFDSYVGRK